VNPPTKYSYLRVMSMLGGLVLVGVAAALNADHAAQTTGYMSPTVIGIVALAFASALAVPVVTVSWRSGRRILAVVALAGLILSEGFGFKLSAERILFVQAQRAQQTETAGGPYVQAKEALDLSIKEREAECAGGLGQKCSKLRVLEEARRTALAALPPPMSHTLVADTTGLPSWLVDLASAMAFSTGMLVLGFALIGFAAHEGGSEERTAVAPAVPVALPDEREQVVSWVREYRRRHGRNPKIPEVRAAFPGTPKTTAWRRIART
jgi:hypothetical protein